MPIFRTLLLFTFLSLLLLGCNFPGLSATPTESEPPPASPTLAEPAPITTAPPDFDTPIPLPCTLSASNDVTAYFRPSTGSNVFGTFSAGMSVEATARTADGWIGFEPGVAQAGNTGIFRLRWVEETSDISLDGACGTLPVVEGPPAGICFAMLMGDTPIYEETDPAASLVTTLTTQEYAAVIGKAPDNWYRLDPAIGDTSSNRAGWAEGSGISLNGPCESLPVINIPAGQTLAPAGGNCTLTANADITVTKRPFPIGPPPHVCFNMAMVDIEVLAGTDPSSPVVATLFAEQYAAITAITLDNWYRIDLGFGNALSNEAGWMEATMINFSGHCNDLPIVMP